MSDELRQAIEVIKAECAKYQLCKDCPLCGTTGGCSLPMEWEYEEG